jgi:hypothetical protein
MKTAQRLDVIRLGVAGGLVWGFSVFFLTLIASGTGYGVEFLSILSFYPGYEISFGGSAVGFIWGFVDGFIGLGLLAWIYNHLHRYGK